MIYNGYQPSLVGSGGDPMPNECNGNAPLGWCIYKTSPGGAREYYYIYSSFTSHFGTTTYSCPSGQNWALSGSTCWRPDCGATQARNSAGICTEKPAAKAALPETCDAATSQPTTGYPIEIGTGSKYWQETLYASGGVGGLNFTLNYTSRKPTDNYLPSFSVGVNWISGYEARINPNGTSSNTIAPTAVSVLRPNGQLLSYTLSGSVYISDADIMHRLMRLIDSKRPANPSSPTQVTSSMSQRASS